MFKSFIILIIALAPVLCRAQSDIKVRVEATSLDSDVPIEGSAIILHDTDLHEKGAHDLGDALRDLPGVQVVGAGGAGQPVSVFLRGANSAHALLLIDGIEVNDPLNPSRGFDISGLDIENVERIEIYKGPQSVRFGSDALSGVINVVTKRGHGPRRTFVFTEGGSYETLRGATGTSGESGAFHYAVGLTGFRTKGFSAADEAEGNSEKDGSSRVGFSTRLGWEPEADSGLEATLRASRTQADVDRGSGALRDDPDARMEGRQTVLGLTAKKRFLEKRLYSTIGFHFAEIDRSDANTADATSSTEWSERYLSESKKIESNHVYDISERHTARIGLQSRTESGISTYDSGGYRSDFARKQATLNGASLIYQYRGEPAFLETGVRADEHSKFGRTITYSASPGYKLQGTSAVIKTNIASGFKAPSLFQLYSTYGRDDLQPEKSLGWNMSLEAGNEALNGAISLFESRYNDLIDFNMLTSKYYNAGQATTKGVELNAATVLTNRWKASVNYTYLDALDNETGLQLLRRPRHSGAITVGFKTADFSSSLEYRVAGERDDIDPVTSRRKILGAYDIVNVLARFKLNDALALQGRLENLFDRRYQEVAGYGTARLSGYLGLMGEF
jgi:vitamin B12 transporter